MLYLIGLGLNVDGISKFGLDVVRRCKRVYLENYTVEFPYSVGELGEVIGKKLIPADREFVEGLGIVDEARKMDVGLLVYGSPLTATTHISLIQEAKRLGIKYKIIFSTSVFDAVAETGLQLYKFGKIASMPAWKKSYEPDSFMNVVKENQSIGAHSLILVDIGLGFSEALEQLKVATEKQGVKLKKILVCQGLGTRRKKIIYENFGDLKERHVSAPYCFVIASKLHFVEKESLERI